MLYKYDHMRSPYTAKSYQVSLDQINKYAAMLAYERFERGVLPRMLEHAGFEVTEEDLSANIRPMARLFFHAWVYSPI